MIESILNIMRLKNNPMIIKAKVIMKAHLATDGFYIVKSRYIGEILASCPDSLEVKPGQKVYVKYNDIGVSPSSIIGVIK